MAESWQFWDPVQKKIHKLQFGLRPRSACSNVNDLLVIIPLSLSRSFGLLANAIGFKKSFSTSDILGIEPSNSQAYRPFLTNRSHSDVQLSDTMPLFRLEASSRSLSTWVAVGDTSATTQLPSPQVRDTVWLTYPFDSSFCNFAMKKGAHKAVFII